VPVDPATELEERWGDKVAEAAARTKQERPDSVAYRREWSVWNAYENGVALLRIGYRIPNRSALDTAESGLTEMAENATAAGNPDKAAILRSMIAEIKETKR